VETLDVAGANWLLTSSAQTHVRHVIEAADAGNPVIKIAEQLSRSSTLTVPQRHAVIQLALVRRKARARYSQAEDMLFTGDALEQLSHPAVARWRARNLLDRFRDVHGSHPERIVDLCAGVGGDAEYLAQLGVPLTCVELDPVRAVFLRHNLTVLGVSADITVADALTVTTASTDAVYADPARRHNGRRLTSIGAYRPSVPVLLERHKQAGLVAITVAPGVDATDAALPADTSVTYLDVSGQLTEAVLWGGMACERTPASATAVILPEELVMTRQDESPATAVDHTLNGWLVTARPAAVRARVHDHLAAAIGAKRVAVHRALFHTATQPPASPWYHARAIMAVTSAQPKHIRAQLALLESRPVEIVLHGVDADVTRLWQQLGSPPRGPAGWRIELIRRDNDTVTVVTDATS
jgi:hypothetical protein